MTRSRRSDLKGGIDHPVKRLRDNLTQSFSSFKYRSSGRRSSDRTRYRVHTCMVCKSPVVRRPASFFWDEIDRWLVANLIGLVRELFALFWGNFCGAGVFRRLTHSGGSAGGKRNIGSRSGEDIRRKRQYIRQLGKALAQGKEHRSESCARPSARVAHGSFRPAAQARQKRQRSDA